MSHQIRKSKGNICYIIATLDGAAGRNYQSDKKNDKT